MATKAQQFRTEARQKLPKRAPAPPKVQKRRATDDDGAQNLSAHAGKKAVVVTEESHSGKRSRKSTRPSSHHGKNSSMLEYASRMKAQTPQHKHGQR